MNITIVNGTNRENSQSIKISNAITLMIAEIGAKAKVVTLQNFKDLFTGNYLTLENCNPLQKKDLENIMNAKIVIFVVPTYHHGIPGSLKNFFDIIDYKTYNIYDKKVIGLVATSGNTNAIKQTRSIINGILSYNKSISIIPPKDAEIDLKNIDTQRLSEYLNYLTIFAKVFNP